MKINENFLFFLFLLVAKAEKPGLIEKKSETAPSDAVVEAPAMPSKNGESSRKKDRGSETTPGRSNKRTPTGKTHRKSHKTEPTASRSAPAAGDKKERSHKKRRKHSHSGGTRPGLWTRFCNGIRRLF